MKKRGDFDWAGAVALTLAIGIALALLAGVLTAELTPGPVTQNDVSLLSTLAGAAIGAVATYLGVKHSGSDRRDDDDEDKER